jgi:hypothetical protein
MESRAGIVDVSAFAEPAFFSDLNLDPAVDAITAGAEEYARKPFFHAPLRSTEAVEYRHQGLP